MNGKAMHSILSAPGVDACPVACPGAACCPTAA